MSEIKECPLCGKPLEEGRDVCAECKTHIDYQYTTHLLDNESSETSSDGDSEEPTPTADFIQDQQSDRVGSSLSDLETGETKSSTKISKGILFLIIGSVVLLIVGVIGALNIAQTRESEAAQEALWANCVEENTPLAYSKYLVRYPNGTFVEESEKRIRESRQVEIDAWEKLRKSSDMNVFYTYLSQNPNTPHLDQIHLILDSLTWITTLKDNTMDAYKAYIENVNRGTITGIHLDEAKERYDYLSQIVVLSGTPLDRLRLDLTDFFKILSENNPKNVLKVFSPTVFYYSSEMSSTAVVAAISQKYTDDKILKITYSFDPLSLLAKRDNKGIIFVDLTIEKEVAYSVKKKKNDKLTENLLLEIAPNKLVQSVKLKKKRAN